MSNIIALDVGERRIGIALASTEARIASVLTTLLNDTTFDESFKGIIEEHQPDLIVVGLPRNLSGNDTPQTQYVRDFVNELSSIYDKTLVFQDEALTSRKAEEELEARGKPYKKAAIDSLSAVYILEDYLIEEQLEKR